jgi:drug/metabolite transporter (DMT)-like permease
MTGPVSPTLRGILFLCAATLCFVTLDSINKVIVQYLPPLEVIWGRYAAQFIMMTVLLVPRFGMRLVRTRRPWTQVARGITLALASLLAVTGLRVLPLADAIAIANLQPLMLVALGAVLLRERVGWQRWLAVILGFVGVVIVVQPGAGDSSLLGAACMFGAALSMALHLAMTRSLGTGEYQLASVYLANATGTLAISATVPLAWVTPPHSMIWFGFAVAGLFGGFGHMFMTRAFTLAPASTLAPFTYTTLIWATAASWGVFGDAPNWTTLTGIAVIAGAGVYSATLEHRKLRAT